MATRHEDDEAWARSNGNLARVLRLAEEMLALADDGDRDRDDASCGILYGILRDSAYRLRKLARHECERHAGRKTTAPESVDVEGRRMV